MHRWRDPFHSGEWTWESDAELASAWWSEEPITDAQASAGIPAHDYIDDQLMRAAPAAVDLLQALVDAAPSEDALCYLGAGPVEDLVSHYGHGEATVAEVERHARQDPRFALAVACVWLGSDVPSEVRRRLVRFGATDITDGTDRAR